MFTICHGSELSFKRFQVKCPIIDAIRASVLENLSTSILIMGFK